VVDALVGFLERLALLLQHVPAVMLRSGVRDDDVHWPRDVVFRPGRRRQLALERPRWRGWRPMAAARGPARPSWSFFVFFSQDNIFIALALWRRLRWCYCMLPLRGQCRRQQRLITSGAAIRVRGTVEGRAPRPPASRPT
jgi:hypothetical protein